MSVTVPEVPLYPGDLGTEESKKEKWVEIVFGWRLSLGGGCRINTHGVNKVLGQDGTQPLSWGRQKPHFDLFPWGREKQLIIKGTECASDAL